MKVLIVFAFAFAALAAAERGKNLNPHKPSTRITHGNEAVPHSRPWQVALYVIGRYYCGGSLIDELNVLTNAQCLTGVGNSIQLVLGAHNIYEDEATQVVVTSSDYLHHEEFELYRLHNDIGLIRLPRPVTFNEYIQPIPVDHSSCSDDYVGQNVTVAGWGTKYDEYYQISPVLLEVSNTVISNDECAEYYENTIRPTKLCTDTTGGKSFCSGDTGGPLVLNGEQGENTGIPEKVTLIDWQTSFPRSPVFDLSNFIYSVGSKKVFDQMDTLLDIYYNSLSDNIRILESDPAKLFSREELSDHWGKYSLYGFITGAFFMQFTMCELEDIPSLGDLTTDQNFGSVATGLNIKKNHGYYKRIRDIVEHYTSYNDV